MLVGQMRRMARFTPLIAALGLLFAGVWGAKLAAAAADEDKPWTVPEAARKVKNPVHVTPDSLAAGLQLYHENCAACHGDTGAGDGPTARIIKKKPAKFTDVKMMSEETDGSLFWKMSEGHGPMPAWKDELSETERWQLVNYLRKLTHDAAAANPSAQKNASKKKHGGTGDHHHMH